MTTLVSRRHASRKLASDEYVVLRTGIINKLGRLYPHNVVVDAMNRYNAKSSHFGVMDTSVNAVGVSAFNDPALYSHRAAPLRMVGNDLVAKIVPLHGMPHGNILASLMHAKAVEFTTASYIKDNYATLNGVTHFEVTWMDLIAIYSTPTGQSANTP